MKARFSSRAIFVASYVLSVLVDVELAQGYLVCAESASGASASFDLFSLAACLLLVVAMVPEETSFPRFSSSFARAG
jgi:hypothetical protein